MKAKKTVRVTLGSELDNWIANVSAPGETPSQAASRILEEVIRRSPRFKAWKKRRAATSATA